MVIKLVLELVELLVDDEVELVDELVELEVEEEVLLDVVGGIILYSSVVFNTPVPLVVPPIDNPADEVAPHPPCPKQRAVARFPPAVQEVPSYSSVTALSVKAPTLVSPPIESPAV